MSEKRGPRLDPAAIPPADLARLLAAAGAAGLTAQMVADDVAHGAPTNPDGTINLVHYAAWLVKEGAGM